MPTLQLKMAPPVPAARQAALARGLTVLAHEMLGKRPEVTAVMIEPLSASQWYVGAAPVRRVTAWLEICITAGTNTADQKAAFIAATHALLQRELGQGEPLEPASYVIVHELPASDWGYGGETQAARQRARQTAQPAATVL